jgi:Cof subfamily protein (haloacid dehalogenase superfamily)
MMNYRLLVIDIDGTLVRGDRSISAEDREALTKARGLGIYVSLSTGRVSQACLGIIDQLSLDGYHIFFDGASVSSPSRGEEVYVKPIRRETVKQAVEFAHQRGIDLELYSATRYFAERETWSTGAHRQFFGIEPVIMDFTKLWERERIIKGGLVTTNPEEAAKAKSFCRHFDDSLCFSRARTPAYLGVDFINVLAPEVSKGKALEALASHLGISLAEVMAIGDGANDIPLLTTAGLAVAMDNATDKVKAVADYVTLDVEHSGIATAVKKFLL